MTKKTHTTRRREVALAAYNPRYSSSEESQGRAIPSRALRTCSVATTRAWFKVQSQPRCLSLSVFLLSHFSTSLCTSSKMRAFLKTHSPVHAGSLCKWLPRMDLYYFTKKHQRRNLFCSAKDMISSSFYCPSLVF